MAWVATKHLGVQVFQFDSQMAVGRCLSEVVLSARGSVGFAIHRPAQALTKMIFGDQVGAEQFDGRI